MAEPTWDSIAIPLLNRIANAEDDSEDMLEVEDLSNEMDEDPALVMNELRRLLDGRYVGTTLDTDFVGRGTLMMPHLLERGARMVGKWPTADPFDALIQYLERGAADEDDPETKKALKMAAGTLGDVGKGVLTGVLTNYVKAVMGMP